MAESAGQAQVARNLYLNLIERCLLDSQSATIAANSTNSVSSIPKGQAVGGFGFNWFDGAQATPGQLLVRNLRQLAEQVLNQNLPGDFMSVGTGAEASVLFKALFEAYGVVDRRVFVSSPSRIQERPTLYAPKPGVNEPTASAGDDPFSAVIQTAFEKVGLAMDRVVVAKFPVEELAGHRLAILLVDCGSFESALDALRLLYDAVSPGGFAIVGVAGDIALCRRAVEEFRRERGISGPVLDGGGGTSCWRKSVESVPQLQSVQKLAPISSARPRPFWSVIVPLYERRQYLKQCLDSILDQDPGPKEMEIFVVDDASPTDLRGFVEQLGRGRIQYVRNPVNLGERANTNRAIGNSFGRWIHILHDDDWVLPGFYAKMRQGVESAPDSVGMAFCMYANWNEKRRSWWSPKAFREGAGLLDASFLSRIVIGNPLNFPAVIRRREAFERVGLFREDLPATGDWEWYVRATLQLAWHHQPEMLACYRLHEGTQTNVFNNNAKMAIDIRKTLDTFSHILPAKIAAELMPKARAVQGSRCLTFALDCLKAGNTSLATKVFQEAIAIDPDAVARAEFTQLMQQPNAIGVRRSIGNYIVRMIQ